MKKILFFILLLNILCQLFSQNENQLKFNLCKVNLNNNLYLKFSLTNMSSNTVICALDRGYFVDKSNVFFKIKEKDNTKDTLIVNLCTSIEIIRTNGGCIDCKGSDIGFTISYSDGNLYNIKANEVKNIYWIINKKQFERVKYIKIILFVPENQDFFVIKTYKLENVSNCDK